MDRKSYASITSYRLRSKGVEEEKRAYAVIVGYCRHLGIEINSVRGAMQKCK